MKITFRTNIDKYRQVSWPVFYGIVPRKGEFIQVHPKSISYCESEKIPQRLEVVSVTYTEDGVKVELHFNEVDFKLFGGSRLFLSAENE